MGSKQKLEAERAEHQKLLSDFNNLSCKVECKSEALLILSREHEQCRSERDQYKLMAEQLRERYSALKRRVEGLGPSLLGVYDVQGFKGEREQSLVQLLCELKEQNKTLKHEGNELKQKLRDAHGDIKLLRDEVSKTHSDSMSNNNADLQQLNLSDREALVNQIEVLRNKCFHLEKDLQSILDEKEELVTARDAFRLKFERLNQQLNSLLRGDQSSYVDIDSVIMENKFLQERIKQVVEEKNMVAVALSKCKAMLEKKNASSGLKLSSIAAGLAISAKQVEQLLQNNHFLEKAGNSGNSADFRNLVASLLEALSDKTLALSHQKKTNKILGNRVSELEQKVKSMSATTLWQIHDNNHIKFLLSNNQTEESISEKVSVINTEGEDLKSTEKSLENNVANDTQISRDFSEVKKSNFGDLDLLPTKEYDVTDHSRRDSISSSPSDITDSQSNTPINSPIRRTKRTNTFSELSPKKPVLRRTFSLQNSVLCLEKHDPAVLDIDDLPPKLQELFVAALIEMDKEEINQKEPTSPKNSPTKTEDPNC